MWGEGALLREDMALLREYSDVWKENRALLRKIGLF